SFTYQIEHIGVFSRQNATGGRRHAVRAVTEHEIGEAIVAGPGNDPPLATVHDLGNFLRFFQKNLAVFDVWKLVADFLQKIQAEFNAGAAVINGNRQIGRVIDRFEVFKNADALMGMTVWRSREQIIDSGFLAMFRELHGNGSSRRFDTEADGHASANLLNDQIRERFTFIGIKQKSFTRAAMHQNSMYSALDQEVDEFSTAFNIDGFVLVKRSDDQTLITADFLIIHL